MSNISDLIYEHHKREIEEKRRNMRVDKAKELYHIHDLEKSFWDKVYDVKIEYLSNCVGIAKGIIACLIGMTAGFIICKISIHISKKANNSIKKK